MNIEWIKRVGVLLLASIGWWAALLAILANKIVSGFINGGAELIVDYYELFSKGGSSGDIQLIRVLIEIDKYSHIIITASLIWIFIFMYIWQVMRSKSKKDRK